MKSKIFIYPVLIFLTFFMLPSGISKDVEQTTESTRQVTTDTWFAYVPPTGVEANLPPYDQWVEIYEWKSLYDDPPQPGNPMEFSTKDVMNDFTSELYLYIFTMALLPDAKGPNTFQLDHLIFYNPSTKEIQKAKWGWK